MVQIIKKISLEVSKPNLIQAIVAKQYDNNSRFLQVTLIHEGKKIEIAPTSTVTINAKRSDGEEKPFAGEANNDGTATVPLTYWMLELEGEVWCDVSVVDTDGRKLTSTKFDLLVERASCSSGDITEDENYDILVKLIEDVKKAKEDLSGQGLQEPPSNIINEWEDNVIYKCTTEKTVSYTFTDGSVQEITIGNALMPFVLKIDTEVYTFGFSVYALGYEIDESTKTINTFEFSFAETLDENSTEWQVPSAKLVYEKIKEIQGGDTPIGVFLLSSIDFLHWESGKIYLGAPYTDFVLSFGDGTQLTVENKFKYVYGFYWMMYDVTWDCHFIGLNGISAVWRCDMNNKTVDCSEHIPTATIDDNSTNNEYPTALAVKNYVDTEIGDIETALDSIIAMQNSLIGGAE